MSKGVFIKLFTTVFGLGCFPIVPGVIGVLLGIIIAYSIHLLPFWIKLLITLGLITVAIPLSTRAEDIFQKKDSHKIIIDEVIGVLVATIWFSNLSITFFLLAVLIFGLFDTTKVYPANITEKLPGGWGVILDDVVAGLYTALAVYLIIAIH